MARICTAGARRPTTNPEFPLKEQDLLLAVSLLVVFGAFVHVLYIASVWEHVPEADGKIVFDKFHVAQQLGDAVDRVRRKENKTLKAAGDDRLTGTRYDWLRNPAVMEPKDRQGFGRTENQ